MFSVNRSWIVVIAASLAVICTACQQKTTEKPTEQQHAAAPENVPANEPVAPKEQPAPQPTAQPEEPASEKPTTSEKPTAAEKPTTSEKPTTNEKPAASEKPASQPAPKVERKTAAQKPKPAAPLPPPAIPKVALSDALRAACLVNVGDTMPEAELAGPAGKMQALNSLYDQKLTVVVFWTLGTTPRSRLVAESVLQDLMKDVAERFGAKGVRVVGINVGDPAAAVAQEIGQAGVTFPNLTDPKGEFFAKIAKDKQMPRIFLLDAAGKVLWFDVEYSRPSRRDLALCIRVVLGEL